MIKSSERQALNGQKYLHVSIARFHSTIIKLEISILCHVIVISQLNRNNLEFSKVLYNVRYPLACMCMLTYLELVKTQQM